MIHVSHKITVHSYDYLGQPSSASSLHLFIFFLSFGGTDSFLGNESRYGTRDEKAGRTRRNAEVGQVNLYQVARRTAYREKYSQRKALI